MRIIGHPWIESERFVEIDSIDKIAKTPVATILLISDLAASIELLHYCQNESLPFAVRAGDIKTALFANGLNARYIVASKQMAKELQELAQNYLFDTQILVQIEGEDEIEAYAKMGIDGVIFPAAIE